MQALPPVLPTATSSACSPRINKINHGSKELRANSPAQANAAAQKQHLFTGPHDVGIEVFSTSCSVLINECYLLTHHVT
jgi:hypothetical protein